MGRRSAQLGKKLRAIVLSTPFVQALALPGCCLEPPGPQPCDGGGMVAALAPGSYSDGGPIPCQAICHEDFSGYHCGWDCNLCSDNGTSSIECRFNTCGGRRPSRLRAAPRARASASPLGILWRDVALLEAAAVIAFRTLERELRAHHAPAGLVAQARRAIHEETRHARVTGALCRSYGGRPVQPSAAASRAARSLKSIARENAVEGCVRETYGALLALWQAKHAGDAKTRRAMKSIAPDEVRHAEIAWSVAHWAEPQLSESARRDIAAARGEAFVELLNSTAGRMPAEFVTVAGLPHPVVARRLAERLGEALSLG
jgi:hypothetical protein